MTKIEQAITWAEKIAKDDKHGYDQINRMGPTDYDCSGLVITAWDKAGVHTGATYTGDMYKAFLRHGFTDVTKKVSFKTGKGLVRGDVLLSPGHHTAMYCGNGKMVDARINENGKITGGKPGDQTGHEIEIHAYNNHPWVYALRYTAEESEKTDDGANATVTTNGGTLNFRQHPSVYANKLTSIPEIPNGAKIKIERVCVTPGWYFVEYKGRHGYVSADWVTRD